MLNEGDAIRRGGRDADGSSGSLPARVSPALGGRQRKLHSLLLQIDPGLASTYMGSVLVLRQSENPERYRQSAHTLREMLNAMPAALGLAAEAETKRTHDVLQRPKKRWSKALERSECYQNGEWRGGIDGPLRRALKALAVFFAWYDENAPKRLESLAQTVRTLDASGRPLPAALESLAVATFDQIRKYFIEVCHGMAADAQEYAGYLSALESFLLDRLSPRPFDDQDTIDTILAEAGDAPDA